MVFYFVIPEQLYCFDIMFIFKFSHFIDLCVFMFRLIWSVRVAKRLAPLTEAEFRDF